MIFVTISVLSKSPFFLVFWIDIGRSIESFFTWNEESKWFGNSFFKLRFILMDFKFDFEFSFALCFDTLLFFYVFDLWSSWMLLFIWEFFLLNFIADIVLFLPVEVSDWEKDDFLMDLHAFYSFLPTY